jgi:hypothetical protein
MAVVSRRGRSRSSSFATVFGGLLGCSVCFALSCGRTLNGDDSSPVDGQSGAGMGGRSGAGAAADAGRGGRDAGRDSADATPDVSEGTDAGPDAGPDASSGGAAGAGGDGGSNDADASGAGRGGAAGGAAGTGGRAGAAGSCGVDCSHLPNVRPEVVVTCGSNSQCSLPQYPDPCVAGFAHCSGSPNLGCETDLSRTESCGACFRYCYAYGFTPVCVTNNGQYQCSVICPPSLQACGFSCVDLATDQYNCGACGSYCGLPNALSECQQGQCVLLACADPTYADCTSDPGCESALGTSENCSGCGDPACALDHTLFTCSGGAVCTAAVCEPGYANCSATSADCESALATAASCGPTYLGTAPLATGNFDAVAVSIGSDGSYFLAGAFTGSVDFDPTPGSDVRTAATDNDAYITKFNANGSYAWTRTFEGRGQSGALALAPAAAGAVVAAGFYLDTIDLDPAPGGVDLHQTSSQGGEDPFVVKLTADGTLVWGRTFPTTNDYYYYAGAIPTSVRVDSGGAVYFTGSFANQIDLDPGPLTDEHTGSGLTAMLVKLNPAGDLAWGRSVDDPYCYNEFSSLALAADGTAWAVGSFDTGSSCTVIAPADGGVTQNRAHDMFLAEYGPNGEARGIRTWGGPYDDLGHAISMGSDGSIYIAGASGGMVDFDPGPGVAQTFLRPGSGFILKLGADASWRWVQSAADMPISSLAGTADGGVLAASSLGNLLVTKLNADRSAAWTLRAGNDSTSVRSLAARGASFAVAGTHSGSADFNPGPGVDIVYGDITFLSRYGF